MNEILILKHTYWNVHAAVNHQQLLDGKCLKDSYRDLCGVRY